MLASPIRQHHTISKSLYRINHTLMHRLTVYATKETQTKSLCYNFNQKWYHIHLILQTGKQKNHTTAD